MIIGVNGKIGSGKDTIGKIAQCLINHPKITNKDLLWMIENDVVSEYSKCEIKKFAGKLKQTASLLTGIPVEMFENQEFKKEVMSTKWIQPKYYNCENYDAIDGGNCSYCSCKEKEMTYREFLQRLGTEAMRDGLHTNVWVNALFADYNPGYTISPLDVDNQAPDNWIITDMRFPNEMEAVKERGGITIRVVRYPEAVEVSRGPKNIETIPFDPTNQKHMDLWKGDTSRLHPSETSLDSAEFDYTIVNNSTIEDLVEKTKEVLIKEQII